MCWEPDFSIPVVVYQEVNFQLIVKFIQKYPTGKPEEVISGVYELPRRITAHWISPHLPATFIYIPFFNDPSGVAIVKTLNGPKWGDMGKMFFPCILAEWRCTTALHGVEPGRGQKHLAALSSPQSDLSRQCG